MRTIRLVCLDFDGTIMCYKEDPPTFHEDVIPILNALARQGVEWCTNSGRNHTDQQGIVERARAKGLIHLPSALLCSESLIYVLQDGDYKSYDPWNGPINRRVCDVQSTVRRLLESDLERLTTQYRLELHFSEHYTAFQVLALDEHPALFYQEIQTLLKGAADIVTTRNGPWINILPREAGKGNTLRRFAELRGIHPEAVLAIGDHLNDESMLNGISVAHAGCPADAVPEILSTVRSAGGLVASGKGPLGTVEIIRHFCLSQTP